MNHLTTMDNHILTKEEILALPAEKVEAFVRWIAGYKNYNEVKYSQMLALFNKEQRDLDYLSASVKAEKIHDKIFAIKQKLKK